MVSPPVCLLFEAYRNLKHSSPSGNCEFKIIYKLLFLFKPLERLKDCDQVFENEIQHKNHHHLFAKKRKKTFFCP